MLVCMLVDNGRWSQHLRIKFRENHKQHWLYSNSPAITLINFPFENHKHSRTMNQQLPSNSQQATARYQFHARITTVIVSAKPMLNGGATWMSNLEPAAGNWLIVGLHRSGKDEDMRQRQDILRTSSPKRFVVWNDDDYVSSWSYLVLCQRDFGHTSRCKSSWWSSGTHGILLSTWVLDRHSCSWAAAVIRGLWHLTTWSWLTPTSWFNSPKSRTSHGVIAHGFGPSTWPWHCSISLLRLAALSTVERAERAFSPDVSTRLSGEILPQEYPPVAGDCSLSSWSIVIVIRYDSSSYPLCLIITVIPTIIPHQNRQKKTLLVMCFIFFCSQT